ncbi:MAG: hypothetical protein V4671_05685 [Armatimonadota bacterium]
MSFHFSRLSSRPLPQHRFAGVTALLAVVSSILCGVIAAPTLAQTPEDDTISVTYHNDDGGVSMITEPVENIGGVPTSQLTVPDAALSKAETAFANVEDGTAFVVTPTIDPQLLLTFNLKNDVISPPTSPFIIRSLTYTLQDAPDFYFDSLFPFGPSSSRFTADFTDRIGSTGTRFRSLVFTAIQTDSFSGLTFGDSEEFRFAINVPGTIGRNYGVQLRSNGAQQAEFDIPSTYAPEPGAASLLLLGLVCLPAAGAKVRRIRRTRRSA